MINEEVAYAGVVGDNFSLQNDIIVPYLLELTNDEQKQRWLPGLTTGESVYAIAMTEPGAGSDLRAMSASARRDGDGYILDGSKTFVTSGIQADRVIVAARTGQGFSLFMVEAGMEGFERGRKLDKVGRRAQDTAELFFNGVYVPQENLPRRGGQGPALPDGAAAARAAVDRGRRRRRLRARADDHARLRARAPRLRAADRVLPAQPLHARVAARQGPGRARVHRRRASWRSTTAG